MTDYIKAAEWVWKYAFGFICWQIIRPFGLHDNRIYLWFLSHSGFYLYDEGLRKWLGK